jgi:hypothetical protein
MLFLRDDSATGNIGIGSKFAERVQGCCGSYRRRETRMNYAPRASRDGEKGERKQAAYCSSLAKNVVNQLFMKSRPCQYFATVCSDFNESSRHPSLSL